MMNKAISCIKREIRKRIIDEKGISQYVPPGHYYSPIPNLHEIQGREAAIFGRPDKNLPGIDMQEADQLSLFDQFKRYYDELPFPDTKEPGCRYHYINPSYSYSDAIFLYCMIRHMKPMNFIEIGSGYSSCVTLDTREKFLDISLEVTCIEPYPDLLYSLVKPEDLNSIRLIPSRLQDADLQIFDQLGENDILFIDSTHVGKVGSDVNTIIFEILPRLNRGVYVHFHDIFYPFEYPRAWIYEGRAWNEAYMLRAFLQFNNSFKIVFMNTYMELFHEELFRLHMPFCLRNTGGSLWLKKE